MPFAVLRGRKVGVCRSWNECKARIDGYSGAYYRKFDTYQECRECIDDYFQDNSSSYSDDDDDDYINCWIDGACPGNGRNPRSAGRGVFFGDNYPWCNWNISERADGPPTNNRAEIQAAWRAIQIAKDHNVTKLRIHTDSDFLIKSVVDYMPKWKRNGYMTAGGYHVKNKIDFMQLDDELDGTIEVVWVHVPAHSGDYGNDQADQLARDGARL
ncbi:Ribonuclease H1 [Sergentomyia squamirostris]